MGINLSSIASSTNGNFDSGQLDTFLTGPKSRDDLKNASNDDLVGMLGNKDLPPAVKLSVAKELESRLKTDDTQDVQGGGGDDDMKQLLKKLQNGTISSDELQKLAGALRVDADTLENAKGKGGNSSTAQADNDILGG